jgi:hypothetical protein
MAITAITEKLQLHRLSPILAFFKRMNGHSLLALAGMVGPLVLATTDFTAALTSPNYNLIKDSISSLALTSLGWLQTIGFLAIGLLVEIFTAGLLFNVKGARGFRFSIGLLVFFGFALLLIGAFRTDPVGGPDTIEGTIHGLTATTAFWIFPVAILVIAPSLKNDPNWKRIFRYTVIAGILAIALVITLGVLPDEASWFGLLERIFVANMIIWVEVAAIKLLLLSVKRGKPVVNKQDSRDTANPLP